MDKYCTLGQQILKVFAKYVDAQNQEASKNIDYKDFKKFKELKPTQKYLAEIIGCKTTNLSAYLKGNIKIPKPLILDITEKLHLRSKDFLELAKLFALQKNELIETIPEEEYPNAKDIISNINNSLILAITANLLFEIVKQKNSISIQTRMHQYGKFGNLRELLTENFNLYTISEIAKILLD